MRFSFYGRAKGSCLRAKPRAVSSMPPAPGTVRMPSGRAGKGQKALFTSINEKTTKLNACAPVNFAKPTLRLSDGDAGNVLLCISAQFYFAASFSILNLLQENCKSFSVILYKKRDLLPIQCLNRPQNRVPTARSGGAAMRQPRCATNASSAEVSSRASPGASAASSSSPPIRIRRRYRTCLPRAANIRRTW